MEVFFKIVADFKIGGGGHWMESHICSLLAPNSNKKVKLGKIKLNSSRLLEVISDVCSNTDNKSIYFVFLFKELISLHLRPIFV